MKRETRLRAEPVPNTSCQAYFSVLLRFCYVRRLRTFLTFSDFELHVVTFLQALIPLRTDSAIVHEHVWPIISTDEPVPLGIVEPFYGSCQTFH